MPKSHVFKTKLVLFSVHIFQNLHFTYLGDPFVGMRKSSFTSTIIYQCNVNLIVKFYRTSPFVPIYRFVNIPNKVIKLHIHA